MLRDFARRRRSSTLAEEVMTDAPFFALVRSCAKGDKR